MYFQDLEYKERNFLDLNNDNYQPICLKAVLGWNILASLIWCVHILPDWLQIMHWLANTGLDFSLENLLYVHVEIILSS